MQCVQTKTMVFYVDCVQTKKYDIFHLKVIHELISPSNNGEFQIKICRCRSLTYVCRIAAD